MHSNQIQMMYSSILHTYHYTSASMLSHSPCLILPILWFSFLSRIENHVPAAIKVNRVVYERTTQDESMQGPALNFFHAVIIPCEGQLTT